MSATETQFYEITPSADGCSHCGAGQYWTICYKDPTGEFIEIGTSWKGEEGKETAQDVCDLMNMAFDAGAESVSEDEGDPRTPEFGVGT